MDYFQQICTINNKRMTHNMSMNSKQEYFWVIGGGLLQVPLVDEVRELGHKVIVSDLSRDCACAGMADIFIEIDIFDINAHINEALMLTTNNVIISGVLAAGIDATLTMSSLATVLGLPGVNPHASFLTNNKDLFRHKLSELGYPVPRFRVIDKKDQIKSAIESVGFPLIVKNTDSSGSRGIKIFREGNILEIEEAAEVAMSVSRSGKALIEELWEGDEYTIETLFDIDGKFHPCFITDRFFKKNINYALELGLRNPTNLPIEIQQQMFELTKNVATDLGIKIGAAKIDMMLTRDGPRIIEMTTRLSGGFDSQYLVPAATGMNVLRAAIVTALGQNISSENLLTNRLNRVGLTGSIWPQPGKIVSITGLKQASLLEGVEHIFFRYQSGEIIKPYIDCTKRVCFIIVSGKDEVEAQSVLDKVIDTISIITEPI
jgi:biotin carboxylase